MNELWKQATEIYNLPLTIGMILFCAYWLISSIGIFDFDTDVDVDVDLDMDADADVDINGGIFSSILNFVNAADVPVMLVLTVLNTAMWMISMISNQELNPSGNLGIAAGLLLVNFIISVIIVRYITKPLAPLFNSLKKDVEAALPLVGQAGIVKSRVLDQHYGQVIVERDKNAPALLNCMLSESDKPLVRGDEVIIIRHDDDARKYIVRSLAHTEQRLAGTLQSTIEFTTQESNKNTETNNLTTNQEQE